MPTKMKSLVILTIACLSLASLKGCHCGGENRDSDDGGPGEDCLELRELLTDEVPPAGVRTVFQLLDCDGYPIPDLEDDEVEVLLDGEAIRTEGSVASVLTQEVHFESYALLLLDMSNSIVDSGNLEPMIAAARKMVRKLVNEGARVAIYRFAGPKYFAEVESFTTSKGKLDDALDELAESDGLGTTDLYGSIPRALSELDSVGDEDVLTTRTLVVFTDGSDEAMVASRKSAENAIKNTETSVFTVGLGGDVDKDELLAFGKDGFEWAENADKLDLAFTAVIERISDLARSYYLLGICSPRVDGWRDMTLVVRREGQTGSLTVSYDATDFDMVGCDVQQVAFPCAERDCGDVGGLSCGSCEGGQYCTEKGHCKEACTGDIECGSFEGVDCGDCSELGDSFACDGHSCEDACADAECGTVLGIDCGDCSELGDSFACDEDHECADFCAEADCGTVSGMDCGDCSAEGEDFACDADHQCVDACLDAACGTVLGIDCGDCSEEGEDFGCDEDHTCVEACADAECGDLLGVDCGDCSEFGDEFGCDDDNLCVNACIDAECGTVLGVDCGDCSEKGEDFACNSNNVCKNACAEVECGTVSGVDCGGCSGAFTCSSQNLCVPDSLPGLSWAAVSSGDFTLGCDMVLDPGCGLDEARREVSLSSFHLMETEITVEMFETCVDDGGCNASYVDTSSGCNYGVSGREDHPVNCVTWEGIKQFCAYAGGRLPTESEWERAFRGDHDDVESTYWIYPWGNSPAPSCSRVVMNEGGPGCGTGSTDQVGTMPTTSFALANMAGNVSEWTGDYYGETFEDCSGPCDDPTGPTSGDSRVVRGGAYDDFFVSAYRTARRDKEEAGTRSPAIGGRCAR